MGREMSFLFYINRDSSEIATENEPESPIEDAAYSEFERTSAADRSASYCRVLALTVSSC